MAYLSAVIILQLALLVTGHRLSKPTSFKAEDISIMGTPGFCDILVDQHHRVTFKLYPDEDTSPLEIVTLACPADKFGGLNEAKDFIRPLDSSRRSKLLDKLEEETISKIPEIKAKGKCSAQAEALYMTMKDQEDFPNKENPNEAFIEHLCAKARRIDKELHDELSPKVEELQSRLASKIAELGNVDSRIRALEDPTSSKTRGLDSIDKDMRTPSTLSRSSSSKVTRVSGSLRDSGPSQHTGQTYASHPLYHSLSPVGKKALIPAEPFPGVFSKTCSIHHKGNRAEVDIKINSGGSRIEVRCLECGSLGGQSTQYNANDIPETALVKVPARWRSKFIEDFTTTVDDTDRCLMTAREALIKDLLWVSSKRHLNTTRDEGILKELCARAVREVSKRQRLGQWRPPPNLYRTRLGPNGTLETDV